MTGVSLRGTAVADSLNPQDGRYTLITRGPVTEAHVIGALDRVLSGPTVGNDALDAMTSPGCRIVSLTVTEKDMASPVTVGWIVSIRQSSPTSLIQTRPPA